MPIDACPVSLRSPGKVEVVDSRMNVIGDPRTSCPLRTNYCQVLLGLILEQICISRPHPTKYLKVSRLFDIFPTALASSVVCAAATIGSVDLESGMSVCWGISKLLSFGNGRPSPPISPEECEGSCSYLENGFQ